MVFSTSKIGEQNKHDNSSKYTFKKIGIVMRKFLQTYFRFQYIPEIPPGGFPNSQMYPSLFEHDLWACDGRKGFFAMEAEQEKEGDEEEKEEEEEDWELGPWNIL
mgnify:CR=1 FL=1